MPVDLRYLLIDGEDLKFYSIARCFIFYLFGLDKIVKKFTLALARHEVSLRILDFCERQRGLRNISSTQPKMLIQAATPFVTLS